MRERVVGHEERRLGWIFVEFLGQLDLFDAERIAVRGRGALLVRTAVADDRMHPNQRRAAGFRDSVFDRLRQRVEIVGVGDILRMPFVSVEALDHILVEAELGMPVDGHVIVVVEKNDVAEPEMAGDRCGLARDAFHQVAVAANSEDAMIEQARLVAIEARLEMLRRHRHADRVADALAERAGSGLDAGDAPVLGMARSFAAELAELLDVVERDVVAGEIESAVEQHRAVAGRQHETIAAEPFRIFRVVAHEARVEQVRDRRHAHRQSAMATVGLLHRVDRQHANRVDAGLVEVGAVHFDLRCSRQDFTTRGLGRMVESASLIDAAKFTAVRARLANSGAVTNLSCRRPWCRRPCDALRPRWISRRPSDRRRAPR